MSVFNRKKIEIDVCSTLACAVAVMQCVCVETQPSSGGCIRSLLNGLTQWCTMVHIYGCRTISLPGKRWAGAVSAQRQTLQRERTTKLVVPTAIRAGLFSIEPSPSQGLAELSRPSHC